MSQEALHAVLTVTGLLCEIVGLTWIVAEASRARREEFGEYGLLRRIGHWFRYWLFEQPPTTQTIHLSGIASAGASGGAAAIGISRETEIERLHREIKALGERVERYEQASRERHASMQDQMTKLADELSGRIADVDARQRALRRTALRGEVRGARLFIVGAALSAVANLV